jgi:hypothetical protein
MPAFVERLGVQASPRETLRLSYDNAMKSERVPTTEHADFDKHGNASKPLSFHPLRTDAAVAALLKVKPPTKPEK